VEFTLPPCQTSGQWCQFMSTEDIEDPFRGKDPTNKVIVGGRSLLLFIDR
jgi:isoamylase